MVVEDWLDVGLGHLSREALKDRLGLEDAGELGLKNLDRLRSELARSYPEFGEVEVIPIGETGFYPGFVLMGITAGRSTFRHLSLVNPDRGAAYVLDAGGEGLDRLERIAPPMLTKDNLASYLHLRLGFLQNERGGCFWVSEVCRIEPTNHGTGDAVTFEADVKVFRGHAPLGEPRRPKSERPSITGIRHGTATVWVQLDYGIVHIRRPDQWAVSGFKPSGSGNRGLDIFRGSDPIRIATPYFVESWTRPARREDAVPARRGGDSDVTLERLDAAADDLGAHVKGTRPGTGRGPVEEPDRTLLNGFEVPEPLRTKAIVRSTELPFYRNFRLFEVLAPGGKAQPGYCLCRPLEKGLWGEPLWLNGTGQPIHAANGTKDFGGRLEIVFPAEELSNEEDIGSADDPVAAYIRFFCWAVEGSEGPFFVPSRLDRLEWSDAPPPDIKDDIESSGLLQKMAPAADDDLRDMTDKTGFFRRALVVYNRTPFEALFRVKRDGMISMENDKPIGPEGCLPVDIEAMRATGRRRWSEEAAGKGNEAARKPGSQEPGNPSGQERPESEQEGRSEPAEEPAPFSVEEDGVLIWRRAKFRTRTEVRSLLTPSDPGNVVEYRFEEGCSFEQGLDLKGATIVGSLVFKDCTFGDHPNSEPVRPVTVDLSDARITVSVRFVNCYIRGDLVAERAHIDRDFEIQDCRVMLKEPDDLARNCPLLRPRRSDTAFGQVEYSPPTNDQSSIKCRGIVVGQLFLIGSQLTRKRMLVAQNIDLSWAFVGSRLALEALRCEGTISIANTKINQDAWLGYSKREEFLSLLATVEARSVDAQGLQAHQAHISNLRLGEDVPNIVGKGRLNLQSAKIAMDLVITNSLIGGDLTLYAVSVARSVSIAGVRVKGNLDATYSEINKFLGTASRWSDVLWSGELLHCTGDVILSGATIGGVDLSGALIDGTVKSITGTFGPIYMDPVLVSSSNQPKASGNVEPRFEVARLRHLSMTNVLVKGAVRLAAVRIGLRPTSLLGLVTDSLDPRVKSGVEVENSIIEGDFRTLPRDQTLIEFLRQRNADLLGDVPAVKDFLDGDPLPPKREVTGDILLRANIFKASLELLDIDVSGQISAAHSEIDIDLNVAARRTVISGTEPQLRTRCSDMDLEKIDCRGNITLTGLVVESPWEGRRRLQLRDAEVKGDLRLVDAEWNEYATIAGEIDGSALVAGRLVLTGCNVGSEGKISLERGRLSRFEVLHPPPRPIDLTAIQVGRWVFGLYPSSREEKLPDVKCYVQVLNNMDPQDRSVWIDVENSLRNAGREEEADDIYRAFRTKMRTDERQLSPAWGDRVTDLLTEYGTSARKPGLCLVVLGLLLWGVCSLPINVEPANDLIQAHNNSKGCEGLAEKSLLEEGPPCERLTPKALHYRWTGLDGFILAARYAVPIIDVPGERDWKASGHGIILWHHRLGVPVEVLAVVTSLVGWIFWPIWLLRLGTKLVRGQRK